MKKFVVKLDLKKKPVEKKIEFGRQVRNEMDLNSNFTNPSPTLAELKTVTDNLEAAFILSAGAGLLETSLLHEKEAAFDEIMTALGKYVDNVARGSESVILSAGMETKKRSVRLGIPERVTGVNATSVRSGEMKITWTPVHGKLAYLGYIKEAGQSDDQYKLVIKSGRRSATVKGLTSGKKYIVVIEAVGSAGAGALSNPATSFIL